MIKVVKESQGGISWFGKGCPKWSKGPKNIQVGYKVVQVDLRV